MSNYRPAKRPSQDKVQLLPLPEAPERLSWFTMKDNDTRDTPADLFSELVDLYGRPFAIDVCACHSNTKVPACYYTLEGLASNGAIVRPGVDGMTGRWPADWFCNPPFSEIGRWIRRAWQANQAGLLIVPNSKGEQPWWQELVEPHRDGRPPYDGALMCLSTHYLPKRRRFLKDGKPILSSKTGQVGSPGFGLVALVWK